MGIYVTPGTMSDAGTYVGGGASVTRNSGNGVIDSAGLLAPGTTSPSYRDVAAGGGIKGSVDASQFFDLPANQDLSLAAFFDYRRDTTSFGTTPNLAAAGIVSVGSVQGDTYAVGGSFTYGINSLYLKGQAAWDFGRASITGNASIPVTGVTTQASFGNHGYVVDLRLGNVFTLLNTLSPGSRGLPKKAPPKPGGGYIIALDLSAHVGYAGEQTDSFTDSTGLVVGTGKARTGDVGSRAKLFALVPANGLLWMPYVAATVDQHFGASISVASPVQAALPAGDVVIFQHADTFWGGQLGLDVRGGGWTVGARGFYTASSDTNVAGGIGFLKIPFSPPPVVASNRY